jgi:hypothetical protein
MGLHHAIPADPQAVVQGLLPKLCRHSAAIQYSTLYEKIPNCHKNVAITQLKPLLGRLLGLGTRDLKPIVKLFAVPLRAIFGHGRLLRFSASVSQYAPIRH